MGVKSEIKLSRKTRDSKLVACSSPKISNTESFPSISLVSHSLKTEKGYVHLPQVTGQLRFCKAGSGIIKSCPDKLGLSKIETLSTISKAKINLNNLVTNKI